MPRTSKNSAPKKALTTESTSSSTQLLHAFQANLLSLISHELRTPLTGILNSLTLLTENGELPNTVSRKELLDMALRNAHRLSHALVSLLELAAIESGNFHVKLREVELARLSRKILSETETLAK